MTNKNDSYEVLPAHDFKDTEKNEIEFLDKGPCFGKRHLLIISLLLLVETTHSVKVYMTICIVAMTDPLANQNKDVPTYNWKNTGLILSSYVWGICLAQMFAGWLVSKFKAKRPIIFMVILCSIVGFLIPTVAEYFGSTGVIICRIIQGVAMGSLGPMTYYFHGKWVPPNERSRLVGVVLSGHTIGVFISMFLSGQIAYTKYGWPLVIYFYSGLCLVWCLIFAFVASDTPFEHSTITVEEQFYIEHSLSQIKKKNLKPPYKKIFTSFPIWANAISRAGALFGFFTILSEMPTYFKNILDVNLKSNGLLSATPYVCTIFFIYSFGFICDFLISRKIYSRTVIRKIMTFFGSFVASIFLLILAQCKSGETVKVIVCLALFTGFDGAGTMHSAMINSIDLAPNFSGTIEGVINQVAMVTASLGPVLVQFIVTDKKSPEQWKIIFYIVAAVKTLTAIIFFIKGSGETQPWNDEIDEEDQETHTNKLV